uniref:Uncharacterized protein n=1 Tax=Clastoptera arizonana TaxID=38151 RepID=A0A1B6E4B7_9HEMI
MAALPVAYQVLLGVTVIFNLGMAEHISEAFTSKIKVPDYNNDLWLKETNFVEDSEPSAIFWQVFEKPRVNKYTENYLKTIINTVNRLNSLYKSQSKSIPKTQNQEIKLERKTTQGTGTTELYSETSSKELDSSVVPVVEELPGVMSLPSQMEVDKSQKFTHSIRYGYGKSVI